MAVIEDPRLNSSKSHSSPVATSPAWRNPLLRVDFRVFRQLGIPLWDRGQLYRLGRINQPRPIFSPEGNLVGGPHELDETPTPYLVYSWFT